MKQPFGRNGASSHFGGAWCSQSSFNYKLLDVIQWADSFVSFTASHTRCILFPGWSRRARVARETGAARTHGKTSFPLQACANDRFPEKTAQWLLYKRLTEVCGSRRSALCRENTQKHIAFIQTKCFKLDRVSEEEPNILQETNTKTSGKSAFVCVYVHLLCLISQQHLCSFSFISVES